MKELRVPNIDIRASQDLSEGGNKNSFRALFWFLLLCVFLGGEASLIARGILDEFDSVLFVGIVLVGLIDGCLAWVVIQKILASKNHPSIPMITADLKPTKALDQTLIHPLLQENITMAEQAKEKNIFPQSQNSIPMENLVPPQTDFSWMEEDEKSLHRATKTTEVSVRELFAYALAVQAQITQLVEALSSLSKKQDLSAQVKLLKQRFRHTCQQLFLQLHPDKYRNTTLEQIAKELFVTAQQAYVAVGEELNKAGSYHKEWLQRKISEIGLGCSKALEEYPRLSKIEHQAVQIELQEAQAFFQRFLPIEESNRFDADDSSKDFTDMTKMYRNHQSDQQRKQWDEWMKDLEKRAQAAYEECLALIKQIEEADQAHLRNVEILHAKHLESSRRQNEAYLQEFKERSQFYVQELKQQSQIHLQKVEEQYKVQSQKREELDERYIKKIQALNDQNKQLSNEIEQMDETFQKQSNGFFDEIMGMLTPASSIVSSTATLTTVEPTITLAPETRADEDSSQDTTDPSATVSTTQTCFT